MFALVTNLKTPLPPAPVCNVRFQKIVTKNSELQITINYYRFVTGVNNGLKLKFIPFSGYVNSTIIWFFCYSLLFKVAIFQISKN